MIDKAEEQLGGRHVYKRGNAVGPQLNSKRVFQMRIDLSI